MLIPPEFSRKIVDVFGESGTAWLAALPALLAECEERWQIAVQPPFPLSYNYVAPATRLDGSEVVLKLGVPSADSRSEIAALRHYGGRGIVALLDADDGRGIMLLERISPGTPLAELGDDESMTDIAAAIMVDLWRPPPPNHAFPTVETWSLALPRLRARYGGTTGPLPADLFALAESRFADLFSSQGESMLLHGDAHHENILRAERKPWLAIDPKGVIGDRGYETGSFLCNQLLHLRNPKQALARRVDQLAERLDYDRARLIAWGLAYAVLSACWSAEDHGAGWEGAIEVARLLAELEARVS